MKLQVLGPLTCLAVVAACVSSGIVGGIPAYGQDPAICDPLGD